MSLTFSQTPTAKSGTEPVASGDVLQAADQLHGRDVGLCLRHSARKAVCVVTA